MLLLLIHGVEIKVEVEGSWSGNSILISKIE